jgi:molybdopterin-guanine dinucleotide biosynthesis protein A
MADHSEEQEMEAEALAAIFDSHFSILETSPLAQWSVDIYPETGSDPSELQALNHVACRLIAILPVDYPEILPELKIEVLKGLVSHDHGEVLQRLAMEVAEANAGVPHIFAVAERLREWLAENNVTGLDDVSMHAQMMRKKKEVEKAQVCFFV